MATKDQIVMNANPIRAVFMEHAKNHGNVTAAKVGVACSAIKIWTIVPIIVHVKMVEHALIPAKDRTRVSVHRDSLVPIAMWKSAIVQTRHVWMPEPASKIRTITTISASAEKDGPANIAKKKRLRVPINHVIMAPAGILPVGFVVHAP